MIKIIPPNTNAVRPFWLMKWLLLIVTIFLILTTAIIACALLYTNSYRFNFFPGVKIAGENLNKLTHAQALEKLQSQSDQFLRNGLTYQFNNQTSAVYASWVTANADASLQIINLNVLKTVDNAYMIGRQKGYTKNFLEQMQALIFGKNFKVTAELNEEALLIAIKENFINSITEKIDARPQIDDDFNITILPEQIGSIFPENEIITTTENRLGNLNNEPIILTLTESEPAIKKADITEKEIKELSDILKISTLTLTYQTKKWEVANKVFKYWLIFVKNNNEITPALDAKLANNYLQEIIAKEINQPGLDAKFEIKNGKVLEFQGSQDGLTLEIEKTIDKINQEFIEAGNDKIEIVTSETKSKITTGSLNDLGISEIIGTGVSNFKGSPKNRIHNIKVGAETLNGLLIKPGEIFSLTSILAPVNAAQGYLPELVIKGDRTLPEYGGGLCQVATTMFRSALSSGLPIIKRTNHTYRVTYYEPAGTDATIYMPNPDLQFTNDTKDYILIQSQMEGDELYFDFWGTKDGRIIEKGDSIIYNIKPAGPTIYIETEDLEPGEKNCIEKVAHAGADAYFDYKITYPDGKIAEERFTSHYVPWPVKCLIGKQPTTPETNSPTSTDTIIQ